MKLLPAIILLSIARMHAANLIVNGHFEAPDAADGTLSSYSSIPGWDPYGVATGVYVISGDAGISDWPSAGQGGSEQFVDIGNAPDTGIMQTIPVPSGFGSAFISWYDATLGVTPGSVLEYSTYTVRLRDSLGEMVGSQGFSTNTDAWALKSLFLPGSLEAGNYTLEFVATTGAFQKDTLIDNVIFVPEPSAATLAALASGLVMFRRRRIR